MICPMTRAITISSSDLVFTSQNSGNADAANRAAPVRDTVRRPDPVRQRREQWDGEPGRDGGDQDSGQNLAAGSPSDWVA
jgi:hypothetical protein